MTPIDQVEFRLLDFDELHQMGLAADCVPGDWISLKKEYLHFNSFLSPGPFTTGDRSKLCVLLSCAERPTFPLTKATDHLAYAVCIARNATMEGVTVLARNSDCVPGLAALSGIAILETPAQPVQRPLVPHFGSATPAQQSFSPDCEPGDWKIFNAAYVPPFPEPEAILLSATHGGPVKAAAAVGIARNHTQNGFDLIARNSDVTTGTCGFNFLSASRKGPERPPDNLWVDTGRIGCKPFAASGQVGDWQTWTITFNSASQPNIGFETPPHVFLTANDMGVAAHNAAAVGIVDQVTTSGFTLVARNSDCAAGSAGFNWAAFGHVRRR
jgi:hypothetical protein